MCINSLPKANIIFLIFENRIDYYMTKNNNIYFSVIIPAFNVDRYIQNTLKSLEKQTYNNFEIIIINDGSTDNTERAINNYISKSNLKIKYFYQNNKGVSAARNKGIKESIGEYIYFLDADDLTNPNLFEKLNRILSNKYDIVYFKYNIIDSNYNLIKSYESDFRILKGEISNILLLEKYLKRITHINMSSFIIKNEIIKENKLYFYEGCINGEDQEFIVKAIVNAKYIYGINETLFYYVNRNGSISNSYNIKRFYAISAFERIKKFLEDNNFNILLKYVDNYLEPIEFYYLFRNYLTNQAKNKDYDANNYKNIIIFTGVPERLLFLKLIKHFLRRIRIEKCIEILLMWKYPLVYSKLALYFKVIKNKVDRRIKQ